MWNYNCINDLKKYKCYNYIALKFKKKKMYTLYKMVNTTETVQTNTIDNFPQFAKILGELETLKSNLQKSIVAVRSLQKEVNKEIRRNDNKRKKEASKKKRAPSGFAKPTVISEELCTFLGKPQGTEMARTEVTKNLTQYIKQNNLQDPQNKRTILPDKKLQKLLNTTKNDEVTYFNLQKYMKVHFPKSSSA